MKISFILFVLILVSASPSCSDRNSNGLNPEDTILLINGNNVQLGEFLLVSKNKKSYVMNMFRNYITCYPSFDQREFWNSSFDSIRPVDKLIEETIKQLIEIKIEQELAKQYGIINEFNHSDFKQTLKQKNSRRKKAVENKQIIHGPIHYSEEIYYGYVHNNMVLALKEVMGKELFNFTDKMYQSCYEGNREALFKKFKAKNRILSEYEEFSEYKELNEVKPYIKQILIDKEYEKIITEKILTAEIKIVTNNFDMYIIKDIFN